jgi:hypothetical protein
VPTKEGIMAISPELLEVLACPACKSPVELVRESWLVCGECERKYPIRDEIPVMLIEEGDKYRNTPIEELPEPGGLGAGESQ